MRVGDLYAYDSLNLVCATYILILAIYVYIHACTPYTMYMHVYMHACELDREDRALAYIYTRSMHGYKVVPAVKFDLAIAYVMMMHEA